jgi:thiamine biosynthesis lipoprotein
VELTDAGVIRRRAGLWLDEGGFGKGVALDAALAAARAVLGRSPSTIHLDLGGQIAVRAPEPERIGVADPRCRERVVCTIDITGGSLATSGNSERGRLVDGRWLGHLLDPRSGLPVHDFGTVTVWTPRAVDADCLSTALHVLGPDAALAFAAEHPDVEVLVVRFPGSAADEPVRIDASAGLRSRLLLARDVHAVHGDAEPNIPASRAPGCARDI